MADPIFISTAGAVASPEELVRAATAGGVSPRAVHQARYLDFAEKIVRTALAWQDHKTGCIIDPYVHRETPTATARYTGALGALMLQGKCRDLAESCTRAMESVLRELDAAEVNYCEFLVKESLFAFMALRDKGDVQNCKRWGKVYSAFDPEKSYGRTRSTTPDVEQRQNFVTFALAGEAMKKNCRLADNKDFFSTYLEEQLARFDKLGMYRDPGAPMVYDITARMNLEITQYFTEGNDPLIDSLRSKLRSGALCSLLYQSPTGEMPFGGRSNQQNFVEASFALVCELEARRWKAEGDLFMAGVFRRAAARAVNCVEPFLECSPIRFNKNFFPPETQHGRQLHYGFYGAYTLLIASQLALASFFADETIPFAETTPAESGSFLWRTTDQFHKVFAAAGGSHLEIELFNEGEYDAVGWGRWHVAGAPAELALSTPVPAVQKFVSVVPASGSLNFGPGRADEGFVSDLVPEEPSLIQLHDAEVKEGEVVFTVDWQFKAGIISEKIRLTQDSAEIEAVDRSGAAVTYHVPMILTDGRTWSVIRDTDEGFELFYKGYSFSISGNGAEKIRESRIAPSRNGLYVPALFNSKNNTVRITLDISQKEIPDDI